MVPLDLSDLPVPDSAPARRASALVAEVSPPFLVAHCLRTYLFGAAIARRDGLRPDHEVLFLASVLHDLGLTGAYDGPRSFEVEGAQAARSFLLDEGLAQEKADLVHEAIALHSSIGVAASREPEIALVHLGAGADVIGFGLQAVHPATRARILAAHPRLDFKRDFTALLCDQADRKPDSHIAGTMKLGFAHLIRFAPLP